MLSTLYSLLSKILATACGAGYSPVAPGTMGAVVGVGTWWLLSCAVPFAYMPWLTLALVLIVTLCSVPVIDRLECEWGNDPQQVVIDEVVGVWISLLAVPSADSWVHIAAAFVLFRLFDIFKPLGIRCAEALKGGWGVMLDDLLAGLDALIIIILCP